MIIIIIGNQGQEFSSWNWESVVPQLPNLGREFLRSRYKISFMNI